MAFPQQGETAQAGEAQKVKIILSSSCNARPRPVPKNLDNVQDINTYVLHVSEVVQQIKYASKGMASCFVRGSMADAQ